MSEHLTILQTVVAALLKESITTVGKSGLAMIKDALQQPDVDTAIQTALERTALEFPEIEGIQFSLREWIKSDEFILMLVDLESGVRSPKSSPIVISFIEKTAFELESREESLSIASQILDTFARFIEIELYKTKYAHFIHASREEVLHKMTRDLLRVIPNEPLLKLKVIEPVEAMVYSYPAGTDEIFVALAERDAARLRLPKHSWAKDQYLKYTTQDSSNDAEDCIERLYFSEVLAWYKRELSCVQLAYANLRKCSRSFYLSLEIQNAGRAPAEGIDFQLTFPPNVSTARSLGLAPPDLWGRPQPPTISIEIVPDNFATNTVIDLPDWNRRLTEQMEPTIPRYGVDNPSARKDKKQANNANILIGDIEYLSHSKTKLINPILISIDPESQAESFVLGYKLHAENQPQDVEDTILIRIHNEQIKSLYL